MWGLYRSNNVTGMDPSIPVWPPLYWYGGGQNLKKGVQNLKWGVMSEALLSGVHVDCEVYGQFSDLLPAVLMELFVCLFVNAAALPLPSKQGA